MKEKSFIHWLRHEKDFHYTQSRDIAIDTIQDWKDGWRGFTIEQLIIRIDGMGGSELAIEATIIAFKEYVERELI